MLVRSTTTWSPSLSCGGRRIAGPHLPTYGIMRASYWHWLRKVKSTKDIVLEEVAKEIVEYEPCCILDFNDQCIVFNSNSELTLMHPKIWLSPELIEEIRSMEQGKDMRKNQLAIIETPKNGSLMKINTGTGVWILAYSFG